MKVLVRVFGDISQVIGKRHTIEIPEGSTFTTLAKRLGEQSGQPQDYLGEFKIGSKDLSVLVNGRSIEILKGVSTALNDGDEVVIMQPTAGG